MSAAPYTAADLDARDATGERPDPHLRATVAALDEARAEVERERTFLAEALACSSQHEATARTLRADLAAARAHVESLLARCDYFKRRFRHPQMDDVNGGAPDAARDWLDAQGQPAPAPDVDPEPWRGEFYVGSFVGPCAHGRDPYTRCDVCEGLTPREAMEAASFAAGVLSVTAAQGQPAPAPDVVRNVSDFVQGFRDGLVKNPKAKPMPRFAVLQMLEELEEMLRRQHAPTPDPWALVYVISMRANWMKHNATPDEALAIYRYICRGMGIETEMDRTREKTAEACAAAAFELDPCEYVREHVTAAGLAVVP